MRARQVRFAFYHTSSNNSGISSGWHIDDIELIGIVVGAQLPTLSVTTQGTGAGNVTSNPTGIACPTDCAQTYEDGTVVTLTPTPDADSIFAGWSGDCSGLGPDSVTMNADRSCTATFDLNSGLIPTPSEVDTDDRYGQSVAIDGDFIVAGAPMDEGGGAVYPFHLVGNEPAPEARLRMPAGFTGSLFGASVAIGGDLLFVGAPGAALSGEPHIQGVIYERVADSWELLQTLTGSMDNGEGQFGASAAFNADFLVVGATLDDDGESPGSGSGAVYLFERAGNLFLQIDKIKLASPDAGARFGSAVGISNGRVAVGATERVVNQLTSGEVTVYQTDLGMLLQSLSGVGSQSGSAARFGASVGIRNNLMLVGAPGEDMGRGATYVFFIGATLDERARLVGSGTGAGDGFGESLSFDGENLVIGAPGFPAPGKQGLFAKGVASSGAVFHYTGANFEQESRIDPPAGLQQFGAAVALQGVHIIIGAPMTDNNAGAVALRLDPILIFKSGFEN